MSVQPPVMWGAPPPGRWDPRSPMWWHRSAGHRAGVIALVVGFYLGVAPGLFLLPLALLAHLGR
jgi:hypothetical protein